MHDQINYCYSTGFGQTRQRLTQFMVPEKKAEEVSAAQTPGEEPIGDEEDVFEIPPF